MEDKATKKVETELIPDTYIILRDIKFQSGFQFVSLRRGEVITDRNLIKKILSSDQGHSSSMRQLTQRDVLDGGLVF